jgi:hypothetical protein
MCGRSCPGHSFQYNNSPIYTRSNSRCPSRNIRHLPCRSYESLVSKVDLLGQVLAAMLAEAWDPPLEGTLACELERLSVTELAQPLEI